MRDSFTPKMVILEYFTLCAFLICQCKELALKRFGDLNEFYMAANVGLWQLVFGILTIPTVGLKFTANYVPLNRRLLTTED